MNRTVHVTVARVAFEAMTTLLAYLSVGEVFLCAACRLAKGVTPSLLTRPDGSGVGYMLCAACSSPQAAPGQLTTDVREDVSAAVERTLAEVAEPLAPLSDPYDEPPAA